MPLWKNDIKCKYKFLFHLKTLAREGLNWTSLIQGSRFGQKSLVSFQFLSVRVSNANITLGSTAHCSHYMSPCCARERYTVYLKKYAHGFVVLCFVVVMQSFIMNSHEVFIHIHQGCFAGTGAIVRLPQCQWSKPDGYGKISQCITTTTHSKAKTLCIFLGIYCMSCGVLTLNRLYTVQII